MKKLLFFILFIPQFCFAQKLTCDNLRDMMVQIDNWPEYIGEDVTYLNENNTPIYRCLYTLPGTYTTILEVDSAERMSSMLFFFEFFTSLEKGKNAYQKTCKLVKKCLPELETTELDEKDEYNKPIALGLAFLQWNEFSDSGMFIMVLLGKPNMRIQASNAEYALIVSISKTWK